MAEVKHAMKYRVVNGKIPRTGESILRGQITDRQTYYIDHLVNYAIDNNYVVGQFEEVKGVFNGCIEAAKALGLQGHAVSIGGWFRIHAELTGQVDETRQLDPSRNELVVRIQALKEFKTSISKFTWTNVEDTGALVKLESICSVGGTDGVIEKDKGIHVGGKRISFNAAWGDSATISYVGLTTPISITPIEQATSYLRFAWPVALADLDDGTALTFSFKFHGKEGGAEQPKTLYAVYKAE